MDQQRIWEHFQTNEEAGDVAFNTRVRYSAIARLINRGTPVLNIGVGRGDLEQMLLAKGLDVHSLDPSENSIKLIAERLQLGDKARVGFSQSIPFDASSFEVVVMSEVLEHLDDDTIATTLTEVKRVLKPDGRFIGTVPADEPLIDNRVICPGCGIEFHRWGHLQSFSEERLSEVIGTVFAAVRVRRMYFADPDRLNWKGRFLRAVKLSLMAIGTRGTGETFLFEARASRPA